MGDRARAHRRRAAGRVVSRDDPDDYTFFFNADLTAEEIEERIRDVLASGKPSRRFLDHLRLMFDRTSRKGLFKATVQRRKAGRPKGATKGGKSYLRAGIARARLKDAKRGEFETIVNDVAGEFGVTPRTIGSDLRKAKENDELHNWLQEKNAKD